MKLLAIGILNALLLLSGCGSKTEPQTAPAQTPQNQPEGNLELQPVGGPEANTPPSQPVPQPTNPQQQTSPAVPQPANPQPQTPQTPPVVPPPTEEQPSVTPPETAQPEPEASEPETPKPGSNVNMVALNLAKKAIEKIVPKAAEEIKGRLGTIGTLAVKYMPTKLIATSDKARPFFNAAIEKLNTHLGENKINLSDEERAQLLNHFLEALKKAL